MCTPFVHLFDCINIETSIGMLPIMIAVFLYYCFTNMCLSVIPVIVTTSHRRTVTSVVSATAQLFAIHSQVGTNVFNVNTNMVAQFARYYILSHDNGLLSNECCILCNRCVTVIASVIFFNSFSMYVDQQIMTFTKWS